MFRKKADELTKEYLRATFLEIFSKYPETEELGKHISFMTSGSRGWAKFYSDEGDLFLRIENIGRNELKLNDVTRVKAPHEKEADRTRVRPGDVLLSITADLGRTCVIPPDFPTAFINQHLVILRLSDLDPTFVAQYLTSDRGMSQINKLNKGETKAGLNFSDIRSIKIPTPPIEIQKQFANVVSRVRQLKQYQALSKQQVVNLFHNLLQNAFNGELVC